MEKENRKEVDIYCPKCKNRVAKYDGKTTIDIIARCQNCMKRVVYHINTGETEIKKLPPREASSGIEFC